MTHLSEIERRMEEHRRDIEFWLFHPPPSRGDRWWTVHFWRFWFSRGYRNSLIAEWQRLKAESMNWPVQRMTGLLAGE